jgi:hypothetical protein
MKRAVITLGEPIVIAQADPSVKDWGAWQFPSLSLMSDGGFTWSKPRIFDDLGVCPQLVQLGEGIPVKTILGGHVTIRPE